MLPLDEPDVVGERDDTLLRHIISTVLRIAVEAWSNVLAYGEVCDLTTETDIAGCLGKEMIALKNRKFGRDALFRIEEEIGTRSGNNPLKPDGRIDIKIIYSFDETEYFGIECKRVNDKGNDLAKKYIQKGLLRFKTGKYSPNHDWMAMIGFVIDGKLLESIERIKGFLMVQRRRTCLKSEWMQETRFGVYEHLYCTSHSQRGKDSAITVLHLFLPLHPLLGSTASSLIREKYAQYYNNDSDIFQ